MRFEASLQITVGSGRGRGTRVVKKGAISCCIKRILQLGDLVVYTPRLARGLEFDLTIRLLEKERTRRFLDVFVPYGSTLTAAPTGRRHHITTAVTQVLQHHSCTQIQQTEGSDFASSIFPIFPSSSPCITSHPSSSSLYLHPADYPQQWRQAKLHHGARLCCSSEFSSSFSLLTSHQPSAVR